MKDVLFHWDTHFGFGAGGGGLHRLVLRGQKLRHVTNLKKRRNATKHEIVEVLSESWHSGKQPKIETKIQTKRRVRRRHLG
jgi:hypothetical protein